MPTRKLLLHPGTMQHLRQLRAHLPQSLLLTGARGVGLHTIARDLAGRTLIQDITPQDKKGSYTPTAPISIERIRELYALTRGKYTTPHFVIIDDADQLTAAAQNALLKLLEEPTANIHFVLTSHAPAQLLPTVQSRLTTVTITPISQASTTALITSLGINDSATIAQLQFAATGLPAHIIRLAEQPAQLEALRSVMGDARQFLTSTPYERLVLTTHHQSSRDQALAFVDALQRLLERTIAAQADDRQLRLLDRSLDVYEQLMANRNVKLQLLRLVV